jgi:hypothetical protein
MVDSLVDVSFRAIHDAVVISSLITEDCSTRSYPLLDQRMEVVRVSFDRPMLQNILECRDRCHRTPIDSTLDAFDCTCVSSRLIRRFLLCVLDCRSLKGVSNNIRQKCRE